MSLPVELLHRRVVGVLVRHEERASDLTTVRVLSLSVEDLVVQVDVVHVDGTVERDRDHLWYLHTWDKVSVRINVTSYI